VIRLRRVIRGLEAFRGFGPMAEGFSARSEDCVGPVEPPLWLASSGLLVVKLTTPHSTGYPVSKLQPTFSMNASTIHPYVWSLTMVSHSMAFTSSEWASLLTTVATKLLQRRSCGTLFKDAQEMPIESFPILAAKSSTSPPHMNMNVT